MVSTGQNPTQATEWFVPHVLAQVIQRDLWPLRPTTTSLVEQDPCGPDSAMHEAGGCQCEERLML